MAFFEAFSVSTIFQNIIVSKITVLPSEVVVNKYNVESPDYGPNINFKVPSSYLSTYDYISVGILSVNKVLGTIFANLSPTCYKWCYFPPCKILIYPLLIAIPSYPSGTVIHFSGPISI